MIEPSCHSRGLHGHSASCGHRLTDMSLVNEGRLSSQTVRSPDLSQPTNPDPSVCRASARTYEVGVLNVRVPGSSLALLSHTQDSSHAHTSVHQSPRIDPLDDVGTDVLGDAVQVTCDVSSSQSHQSVTFKSLPTAPTKIPGLAKVSTLPSSLQSCASGMCCLGTGAWSGSPAFLLPSLFPHRDLSLSRALSSLGLFTPDSSTKPDYPYTYLSLALILSVSTFNHTRVFLPSSSLSSCRVEFLAPSSQSSFPPKRLISLLPSTPQSSSLPPRKTASRRRPLPSSLACPSSSLAKVSLSGSRSSLSAPVSTTTTPSTSSSSPPQAKVLDEHITIVATHPSLADRLSAQLRQQTIADHFDALEQSRHHLDGEKHAQWSTDLHAANADSLSPASTRGPPDELDSGWDLMEGMDSPSPPTGVMGAVSFLQVEAFHKFVSAGIKAVANPILHIVEDIVGMGVTNQMSSAIRQAVLERAPKQIIYLTRDPIRRNVTNQVTDATSLVLTRVLRRSLPIALTNYLSDHITRWTPPLILARLEPMLEKALQYDLVKIIPPIMRRALPLALTYSLTRSLTHSVVPSVASALSRSTSAGHYCYLCYYHQRSCYLCNASPESQYYLSYHSTYFADYYSDYYTPYYYGSINKVENRNNPDVLPSRTGFSDRTGNIWPKAEGGGGDGAGGGEEGGGDDGGGGGGGE